MISIKVKGVPLKNDMIDLMGSYSDSMGFENDLIVFFFFFNSDSMGYKRGIPFGKLR